MSDVFDTSLTDIFQVGYHINDNIVFGGFNETCISLDYNVLSDGSEWEINDEVLETIIQICNYYDVSNVIINFAVIFNSAKELYFPKNLNFIVDADATIKGKTITNLNMIVKAGWELYMEGVNKLLLNDCNIVARSIFVDNKKIPKGNYKLSSNVLKITDFSLEKKITDKTVQSISDKILRNNQNTNIQRIHITTGEYNYYNITNNFFKYPNEELSNILSNTDSTSISYNFEDTKGATKDTIKDFKDTIKATKDTIKDFKDTIKATKEATNKRWIIMDHRWVGKDGKTYYDRYDVKEKAHYEDSSVNISC